MEKGMTDLPAGVAAVPPEKAVSSGTSETLQPV